jgi:hypothetical protein
MLYTTVALLVVRSFVPLFKLALNKRTQPFARIIAGCAAYYTV